jgi:hypothetical protein
MPLLALSARLKFPKLSCVAGIAALAFCTSGALASFTYSSTSDSAAVTIGTANTGTQNSATPVFAGTASDGSIAGTTSYSGQFSGPTGLYGGSGTTSLTYAFDISGVTLNSTLSSSSTVTNGGTSTDTAETAASTTASTNFTVATTSPYIFNAALTFGGNAGKPGELVFTYTVTDNTTSTTVLNDSLTDNSSTADTPGAVDESLTLTAGDSYTLNYSVSLDASSPAANGFSTTSLTGSADVSILATQAPEPACLSLLMFTVFPLAGRSLRRRRMI